MLRWNILLGLITNAGDGGDRSDIQTVRDMVEMYITGDALILLTVTMRGKLNVVCKLRYRLTCYRRYQQPRSRRSCSSSR